nr:hypothetical protein [Paenibacillus phyllosphaerae]
MFMRGPINFGVGTIFTYFWPTLFVLPLSVFFHWMYFSVMQRRGIGLLVPGGVLFTVAIVCQVSMLFDAWHYMWPGFILAPAVGLFELYWFGGRNKYLLIPINILTILSVLFFAIFSIGTLFSNLSGLQPFIAAALIAGGGLLILMRKQRQH